MNVDPGAIPGIWGRPRGQYRASRGEPVCGGGSRDDVGAIPEIWGRFQGGAGAVPRALVLPGCGSRPGGSARVDPRKLGVIPKISGRSWRQYWMSVAVRGRGGGPGGDPGGGTRNLGAIPGAVPSRSRSPRRRTRKRSRCAAGPGAGSLGRYQGRSRSPGGRSRRRPWDSPSLRDHSQCR